jgi:hypothetical protein
MARSLNAWRGTIKRTIPAEQALYFLPQLYQVSLAKAWHKVLSAQSHATGSLQQRLPMKETIGCVMQSCFPF